MWQSPFAHLLKFLGGVISTSNPSECHYISTMPETKKPNYVGAIYLASVVNTE